MDFADIFRPETLIVTIAATGVPQPMSATSLRVKQVAIEQLGGNPKIGDASNQVLTSLALNGGNQWIDLASIYVAGNAGDQLGALYSRTFKG